MNAATKKINLGSIEVSALVFQSPFSAEHQYVVGREDLDLTVFMDRYPGAKRATGLQMDDTCTEKFWLVFVADCYDPPCAIVRADTPTDAEEIFIDELPWAHIEEPDLKDYVDKSGEPTCSFGPSGQPYDSESVMVHEIKLIRAEV